MFISIRVAFWVAIFNPQPYQGKTMLLLDP